VTSPAPRDENHHALEVLEFPQVLEKIAGLAVSGPGRKSVMALRPLREAEAVAEALALTDEMVGLLLRLEPWSPPDVPEALPALQRAGVDGATLEVEALADVLTLIRSSRIARGDLRRFPDELPRLAALGESLARLPESESRLDRSLDPAGGLSDEASPQLARLRRALRDSRSALVRRLERFVHRLPERLRVADASVTVRSGRYCVPIRREGLSQIGGIVHDESSTHRTLFVEPPEAIEPMNRLAELERSEAREVHRVLRELTGLLRPDVPALSASLGALAETDSACARARYALAHGGARPVVGSLQATPDRKESAFYRAVDARHPLLESGDEPVVPFHLELRADESVLLISGPNAGGKTVLLKAIGLLSAMAQSGIIPPVGEGTRLPLFRSFHAMIGDEQSILASLSTFSAHVEGLRRILESADEHSLVLIDELGGGTDPAEGGALASAVLLRLTGQAGLSVVTTHLGELKDLAAETAAIVNASLQFDARAMRPTFRLLRDRPGRSYALEIASRLGLPSDVLSAARSRLTGEERRVEALLKDLEERETELDRVTLEARRAAQAAHEAQERAEVSEARIGRREREVEREARRRVERYLLEARQAVEREIERLRSATERARSGSGEEALESAAREVRSGVESLLRESRARKAAAGDAEPAGEDLDTAPAVGEPARSRSLGIEGEILEVRGREAILETGGVRVTVPVHDLEPVTDGSPESGERRASSSVPELVARTEIDLRGLRVDEVERVLSRAMDAAVVNDAPSLRIIHGKGTGALRSEVERLLDVDRRVRTHRPGGFQEGGTGVTVVEFTTGEA
jgi:DNA mismatch repair protein MutS2